MSDDKKLNEIIRIQKRSHGYVMIDKNFLENSQLSWKAKGILAYLLSKPDNWKVIVKDLINHSTDGKTAVYGGLSELQELGYYEKKPVRDESGRRISHWESTVYESPTESLDITPSSLLPSIQEVDNQDIGLQDIENRERNNNKLNKIYKDFNNNQSSQVLSVTPSRRSENRTEDTIQQIEAYSALIKENISYNDLAVSMPHEMKLIDEFIAIIVDVLMTKGEYVHVSNENKPRALVKHNLLRLNCDDIEHVVDQYKSVAERIIKKKQYILTMLYNCKLELDAHYTNLVKSDMWSQEDG